MFSKLIVRISRDDKYLLIIYCAGFEAQSHYINKYVAYRFLIKKNQTWRKPSCFVRIILLLRIVVDLLIL